MPTRTQLTRVLAPPLLAAAMLAGSTGAANAAPQLDAEVQAGDCGPGQSWTSYNQRLDRQQTTCLDEPTGPLQQPKVIRKEADHPWNPWTWVRWFSRS